MRRKKGNKKGNNAMAGESGTIQKTDQRDLAFLAGGGEMGARMRAHDWTATSLGDPREWPHSLKAVVQIILNSRFAMWMAWGSDLIFFCNDAYLPTVGIKQEWVLGARSDDVWAEIWPDIGPRIDHVLQTGEATWDEALLLYLERSGFSEETYHTFSYSPLADDGGRTAGMLCVVAEVTERIIGERQLAALRDFGARLTASSTRSAVMRAFELSLDDHDADLPFALTYLTDSDCQIAHLAAGHRTDRGAPRVPAVLDAESEDTAWPLQCRAADEAILVDLTPDAVGGSVLDKWQMPPRQAIVMPIVSAEVDAPVGHLIAGLNPHRRFDSGYRGFVDLLVGQLAAAIARADEFDRERARAEALAEVDRAKTAFFSNVSHEFRTPLTLMLGPLDELLSRPADSIAAEDRTLVDVAQRNGTRLLRLVNALLDFSRIEAGRAQANFEPTDIGALTAELASTFRSATEKAGLSLTIACDSLDLPSHVDRAMWETIVLNLMSNAFKFTFEGEIAIALEQIGERAVMTLRDTGTGIPADELPKLFERFHRVEGAKGRSFEGSGIGLALVKELVALHGGEISVRSKVGHGTTFIVALPLPTAHEDDQVPTPAVRASSARARAFVDEALQWLPDTKADPALAGKDSADGGENHAQNASRPRVLVADDNADMRQYVARLLRERGYAIEAVADGEAALDAIRGAKPDLIVTDVMMPKLDGFELLRAVRSDANLRDLPVIMLSARAGEEVRVEGLDAGADDYLTKPFSARELVARVDGTLAMARLRRESAEALRESETRYRLAARATSDAIWDWDLVEDRVVWNDAVTTLFGYPLADVEPTGAWWLQRVTDGDRERVERSIHAAIDGTASDWAEEYSFRRADGSYSIVLDRGYILRSVEGAATRMIGAMLDVTDRKHAEVALQNLNETLEERVNERTRERDRMWALSRDPFLVADLDGHWLSPSPVWTELLGWSMGELVGRTSEWMEHPDDRVKKTRDEVNQIGGGKATLRFENRLRAKDGTYRWFSWTAVSENDLVYAVARDVTEAKKAATELEAVQEALRQAQKMEAMGQLTGGVAHDFNNLLTPIVGSLDMLQRQGLGGEREQRLIAGAVQSADRAKVLVQRLLAFARRQPLQSTAVDVGRLVRDMASLMESTTGPQIKVVVEVDNDIAPARADANQLEMALLNLGVNARDAMSKGGTLRISVSEETITANHRAKVKPGSYIRMSVADTGVGMDEATLARSVEPFFSTKGVGKGTGLGLSMVHGLASQLGGALTIQSRLNVGTNIELWLPVSPASTIEDAPVKQPAIAPVTAGSALLVDDEELVRMSTSDMLRGLGYDVTEAASAEEALRVVRGGFKPDLLVTDHLMPGMNGTDLARALLAERPSVKVLIVSGYAEADGVAPDLPRLTKPFRHDELAAMLADLSRSAIH